LISAANNTQDSWGISIGAFEAGASATASETTLDILIGGATDDVLIKSLIIGGAYAATGRQFFFPVHVPAGVRIAAAITSVSTTFTPRVAVWLYGGSSPWFRIGRKVTTYGTQINGARGVAVTPSASGAAASATQITASTTEDAFALLPGFQTSTDTTIASAVHDAIGIGLGAATEERIGTWWHNVSAAEHQTVYPPMPVFRDVPAGSRLTLLASAGGALDAAYDGLIYAVS
jgi:hypothetical protein